jgi:hypothetical protein
MMCSYQLFLYYMKKKHIVLLGSLLVVSLLFVINTQKSFAACECVRQSSSPADQYDNQGLPIPPDAYGMWISTPIDNATEPFCPLGTGPSCIDHGAGIIAPLCENHPCNVYTQGFVRTWFRVPTLGDLIGNAIRLIFFIAGLYALVLMLLGAFEWVSSGGDDKKLTSARGKIMNAVIGLVVMVAILTLVIVLEQVVFGGKVCLGISCPINMGDLSIIK